jgi:hypothetical protein
VLLTVLVLAALAFYTSLGGQKLFEGKLLKESTQFTTGGPDSNDMTQLISPETLIAQAK